MKIVTKFLILCIIFGSVNGCQKQINTRHKSITLNLQEGDPPSLNPYVGVDLRSRCLYLNLFEPLMRREAQGDLKCAAADRVEIDPTQTVYTFHIRPHRWSNGEPVTSAHFANAWRYALQPDSPCFRADLFYLIKNGEKVKKRELSPDSLGIQSPDPSTLIVTLEHPTPYFLDLAASSFYCPLYEPTGQEPTCFNGPFSVKESLPDRKLTLHRNPYYWDLSSVEIDEICFTMVKDPMTAYALFEKGELDVVGDPFSPLPFDLIPTLVSENRIRERTVSRIFYLLLNTETHPLSSASIRKALSLSLDREALTNHLFFGEIPTVSPLPVTLSTLQGVPQEDYLLLFEKGLEELGLTRETFPTLVFSYAELSGQKKLAEFVQEQWQKKLGISVEIICNEWNIHAANLRKGNYQIGTLHLTTLYQDPMFYLDLFRDKTSRSNYCRWEDPQFQAMLLASEQATDLAAREAYIKQAEAYLYEHMPAISLFTQNFQYLQNDISILNFQISASTTSSTPI